MPGSGAAFAPAGAPTASATLPIPRRRGGSRERCGAAIDAHAGLRRCIRACRRSYGKRRAADSV